MSRYAFWLVFLMGFLSCANGFIHSAEASPSSTVEIGFRSAGDLFECYPGEDVRLEESGGEKAMRWDLEYVSNQHRLCTKNIDPGALTGMDTMSFKVRSNNSQALWIQIQETSGEGFYKIITPRSNWETFSFNLSDLTLNEDKVINGRLDIDKISGIHVIDPSALGGAPTADRTIWFADWKFESVGSYTSTPPKPQPASRTDPIPVKKLSTGKVGVSVTPQNWRDTEEVWLKVISKAREAGPQVLSVGNMQWSEEVEPSPRVYDWRFNDRMFSVIEKFDFEVAYDIGGPFFLENTQAPKHYGFKLFTDPGYVDAYKNMLTSFLERYGDKITYLLIHAEGAYAYFGQHPKHVDDYIQFLTEVRAHIKKHSPHIQMGVNTDPHNEDDLLSRMSQAVDFMGYDIMRLKILQTPAQLEQVIKRLVRLAGGKKIAMQNMGWSTSRVENSSDEQQAEFIREMYRVLYKYREKIEFASFATMYDDDTAIVRPAYRALFPDYPDSVIDDITESVSHGGVHRKDGTPKPGWYELKRQIAAYYDRFQGNR